MKACGLLLQLQQALTKVALMVAHLHRWEMGTEPAGLGPLDGRIQTVEEESGCGLGCGGDSHLSVWGDMLIS